MKALVDTELCMGHGQCYARGPEVYTPDDDGFCTVEQPGIDAALRGQAQDGAEAWALRRPSP